MWTVINGTPVRCSWRAARWRRLRCRGHAREAALPRSASGGTSTGSDGGVRERRLQRLRGRRRSTVQVRRIMVCANIRTTSRWATVPSGSPRATCRPRAPGGARAAATRPALQPGAGFPARLGEIGSGQLFAALQQPLPPPSHDKALEQQVVQAERDVERRVAEPAALGVQQHRPVRAEQDVLRADVAVDERPGGWRRSVGEPPRSGRPGRGWRAR